MRLTTLVLAAATAVASLAAAAPAHADHGCVPPPDNHFREICVIPHECHTEGEFIVCTYH